MTRKNVPARGHGELRKRSSHASTANYDAHPLLNRWTLQCEDTKIQHGPIKCRLPVTAHRQAFPEAEAHYQQSSSALHLAKSALQAVPAQASAAQLLSEYRSAWWLWNRRVSLSGIGPCRTRLARHAGSAAAMQGSGLTGCSCNVRRRHELRAAAGVVGSCAGWFFVC